MPHRLRLELYLLSKDVSLVHRHLLDSILQAVAEIFGQTEYADKVIKKYTERHRKWGSRDRKFFAEQVYEIVRWWKKYWFLIGEEPSLDTHQLLKVWAAHYLLSGHKLPDWPELKNFSISESKLQEMQSLRAVRESIPDWMDAKGLEEMGSRWDSIAHSLNGPSTVDLRANSLKATVQQVQKALFQEGIETSAIDDLEYGLTLVQRKNLNNTKAFQAGLFEIQDRASQLVAPFLKVEPGQRVIDACAGAGGKSLHIASLMKNKGQITSMDITDWKLNELRKRAQRNGVSIIETQLVSDAVIQKLAGTGDRVLLDVPCSGMGVLRRNPDAKWKLRPESFQEIYETQSRILESYSQMTKPGGILVYATCSFLPSENEKQVENFLSANGSQWKLEEQLRIDPDQGRGDGFFAARLIRLS